jgi:hypothetical protein
MQRGDVLIEQGDRNIPFFVVVSGEVEIVRPSDTSETIITVHRQGNSLVRSTRSPDTRFSSGRVSPRRVTDTNLDSKSYMAYLERYWLTLEGLEWFWNNYGPNNVNCNEPTISPLHASIDQLGGLPAALVITGEFNVLRDEGEIYVRKLNNKATPLNS